MPVYTYRCDNCGVQFDHRQSFTDPVIEICPECSEKALHKVYTPVGIVFKGSGFYATDNRSPSGQNKKTSGESTSVSDSEHKSDKAEADKPNKETKAESPKSETPPASSAAATKKQDG
jgi:putative FmdB family regulatory protein